MKQPAFTSENWLIGLFLAASLGVLGGHWVSQLTIGEIEEAVPQPSSNKDTSQQTETSAPSGPAVSWQVEDSTAQVELRYDTPVGEEENLLSLSLDGNMITAYQFDISTANSTSERYQQEFAEELDQIIIGKSIDELAALDTLGGATVTTDAFTNALKQFPS